jgi:hypothetical protein
MRLKLDLGCRYALSATIQDTPTRNAPEHLTFPLPLLHHLQLVHVDVVPIATSKECSDHTCLFQSLQRRNAVTVLVCATVL